MNTIELSSQQAQAAEAVRAWFSGDRQVFRLFGYAGTGKTTVAREIAEAVAPGRVAYAAFTGKAALVMQSRGCEDASTIHRLIYKPCERSGEKLRELTALLEKSPGAAALAAAVERERREVKKADYVLSDESDARAAKLIVIDEVSMVDAKLGGDLLSFGKKVLVLGDPAQLPPPKNGEAGFFTRDRADFLLTEIHRQAAGSPVIRLATAAREGRPLPRDGLGRSAVVPRRSMGVARMLDEHDQVICAVHRTRRPFCADSRAHLGLRGEGALPTIGDRLICLRNNHKLGLLNGQQWRCAGVGKVDEDVVELSIDGEDGGHMDDVPVYRHWFEGRNDDLPAWNRKVAEEFDYAYAITCHKSQGSQWSSVCVVDEAFGTDLEKRQWRYTAITRAAERVTVLV